MSFAAPREHVTAPPGEAVRGDRVRESWACRRSQQDAGQR